MSDHRSPSVFHGTMSGQAAATDTTGPVMLTWPQNGHRADAPLVFTFDEDIKLGTGTISLLNNRGQGITETLAGSPYVTVSGKTLTFAPPQRLDYASLYSITFSNDAITDLGGNRLNGGYWSTSFQSGLVPEAQNVTGTAGVDIMNGSDLADTMDGLGGSDTINGYGGDDILRGGDETSGQPYSNGDTIRGGAGNDTIHGGAGGDNLSGDDGNDRVFGGDDNDYLYGNAGDDYLEGGAGNDMLNNSLGDDTMLGGDGDDNLSIDHGATGVLDGGSGNDRLSGYLGTSYAGGSGDDVIDLRMSGSNARPATVSGGSGRDTIRVIFGSTQTAVAMSGGEDADTFIVDTYGQAIGANALRITDFTPGAGGDQLNLLQIYGVQENGNPFTSGLLRLLASGADTLLQLRDAATPPAYATLLTLTGVQPGQLTAANFVGGIDPRGGTTGLTLTGTAERDQLEGMFLDDTLYGLDGDDALRGGAGNDLLEGGAGDDYLEGNGGDNILRGGDGDDRLSSNTFGNNLMEGGAGNDIMNGGAGNDRMLGGAGNDILQLESVYGNEVRTVTMAGEDGNDTLRTGFAPSNVKIVASGGAGADTFEISSFADLTILDFGQGDVLDLRPIHFNVSISGNPFGTAGYLKAVQEGAHVRIYADGDGAAGSAQPWLAVTLENIQLSALTGASFAGGYDPSGTNQGVTLRGTAGADTLKGGALNDIIEGGDGNDTINGEAGDDKLYGGDETIVGGGDTISGGLGNDELHGGTGNDSLEGGEGDDRLYGGGGDDRLDGGAGTNYLEGGDGRDILSSYSGKDHLLGGAGDDTLTGGWANMDGAAVTILDGGDGNDQITAYGWAAKVLAGAGDDTVSVEAAGSQASNTAMVVDMGAGNDRMTVRSAYGETRPIQASGGAGVDTYRFEGSERWPLLTITDFQTGAGGDVVDLYSFSWNFSANPFGTAGQARLVQDGSRVLLQIDLDGPAGSGAWASRIAFENTRVANFTGANFTQGARPDGSSTGLEIAGTAGNDNLQGGHLDDTIRAGDGNDTLTGNAGADKLYGDAGDDQLSGRDGNDRLEGDDGKDYLYGEEGNDELLGGAGNDILQDQYGDNILRGGDGDDGLYVATGRNALFGDAGNDRLRAQGSSGTIDGGAGDDIIEISGFDIAAYQIEATGGDGNDTFLVNFLGNAASTVRLSGGAGVDTYRPGSVLAGTTAYVNDFQAGAGGDIVDIMSLVAPSPSNPFAPGGSAQLIQRGADTVLQARVSADSGAAFADALVLRNVDKSTLTAQNFSYGFNPDGSATGQTLVGTDGRDQLEGGWLDDILRGGAGNDVLSGSMGNDRLEGGDGDDQLDGDRAGVVPVDGNGSRWPATFSGDDVLDGGAGNDTLTSSYGADTLRGGAGDDLLVLARYNGFGTAAFDYRVTLDGGDGNDRIMIQNGIQPTIGATMSGGDGSDTFQLNVPVPAATYVITDFQAGAGGDVLDVFELLGWVRQSPFATGHFSLEQRGADTVLRFDEDGSEGSKAAADLVTLRGIAKETLSGANFRYGYAPGDSAGSLAPEVHGSTGRDRLEGNAGSDLLHGNDGNDVLMGGGGNDLLAGGAGVDTAVFSGARGQYALVGFNTYTPMVADLRPGANDGKDRVDGIERLVFADSAIAFDTGTNGNAGQAYRLYRAAFDREPDLVGLGFWIEMLDRGVSLQTVAGGFTQGEEFIKLFGANASNAEIVTRLYQNILDREPEKGGYDFWVAVLDEKRTDLGTVLAAFSESNENYWVVAGLIGNGFEYQPYLG
ncbi:DUF4214 domain-containing protein [Massilia agri]|uniref:DUF4214 domain-containing protein n=1 Tax=Massilia agri TaxID=1886785 RepID=A0ABT2AP10_9BURK|nr:DUF4214 domain-containing protein [Massilia agri]MCS0597987.1 DUF4214 domain-containing protein [Massilia agri]